jgi:NADH-quinone oxidoreductase subunit N
VILGLLAALALAGGLGSSLLGARAPRAATAIGLGAALGSLACALLLPPTDQLVLGGTTLVASGLLQVVAVAWAAGTFLLGCLGLAGGLSAIAGPSLMGLGATVVALGSGEASLGFAVLACGSVAAVLPPVLGRRTSGRDDPDHTPLVGSAVLATAGAAVAGLTITAWGMTSAGPLGVVGAGDPAGPAATATAGLALLAIVAAVVVRTGAIPAHLWAARFIGGAHPLTIPASLAWGAAAFTLVALAWSESGIGASGIVIDDLDRAIVGLVALASLGLGGLAAILHDDLEHVLGYSIVQAAGVSLLAFAVARPADAAPARDWIVAAAALMTGLAGWIAAVRWAFGHHRVSELRGWARRSPMLALAYVVLLIGFVGLPGMALFEARVALAAGWLPGLPGSLLTVFALSPIVALGRVLTTGLSRPTLEISSVPPARLGVPVINGAGWSRGGLRWAIRTIRTVAADNVGFGVASAAVLLAAIGLAIAITGAGSAGAA